jgi:hypothetical protein
MDQGAKYQPDLLKSSIHMGFKAFKAASFMGINTGTTWSSCALLISKQCLATCLLDINICIILMGRLSVSFLALSEIGHAES